MSDVSDIAYEGERITLNIRLGRGGDGRRRIRFLPPETRFTRVHPGGRTASVIGRPSPGTRRDTADTTVRDHEGSQKVGVSSLRNRSGRPSETQVVCASRCRAVRSGPTVDRTSVIDTRRTSSAAPARSPLIQSGSRSRGSRPKVRCAREVDQRQPNRFTPMETD